MRSLSESLGFKRSSSSGVNEVTRVRLAPREERFQEMFAGLRELLLGQFRSVCAEEEWCKELVAVDKFGSALRNELKHSRRKKSDPTWGLETFLEETTAYFTRGGGGKADDDGDKVKDDLTNMKRTELLELCRSPNTISKFCGGFSKLPKAKLKVLIRTARLKLAAEQFRASRKRAGKGQKRR